MLRLQIISHVLLKSDIHTKLTGLHSQQWWSKLLGLTLSKITTINSGQKRKNYRSILQKLRKVYTLIGKYGRKRGAGGD